MAIEQLKDNVISSSHPKSNESPSSHLENTDPILDKITSKKLKEFINKIWKNTDILIEWFEYGSTHFESISIDIQDNILTISWLFNTLATTENIDIESAEYFLGGKKSSELIPIDFNIKLWLSNERGIKFQILTKSFTTTKQITNEITYSSSGESIISQKEYTEDGKKIPFGSKQQQKLNAFLDYAIAIINKNPWKG